MQKEELTEDCNVSTVENNVNKKLSLLLLHFMQDVNHNDSSFTLTMGYAELPLFSQGRGRISVPIKKVVALTAACHR